jgi:hypothetical protein
MSIMTIQHERMRVSRPEYSYAQSRIATLQSMGLLGVARANTAVGVSPQTFLLLLQ